MCDIFEISFASTMRGRIFVFGDGWSDVAGVEVSTRGGREPFY